MQQHSGQHLITALADTMFGYKTTSWELGRQRSTIELDTPCVKPGQLQELEECVNEKIRAHIPVMVQLLSIDDPAVEKQPGYANPAPQYLGSQHIVLRFYKG
uniref:Alanyl-tRNA synthetase domain containing 1 n=2 Tax=Haplochromini TaxID=319058 RepID=A0A3B4GT25_9CICH